MSPSQLVSPPLGVPLPLDEHACSVSMPRWQHVIGYEEGEESVSSALSCGYPRFVYHPYLLTLMTYSINLYCSKLSPNENVQPHTVDCVLMPSLKAANRCRDFIVKAAVSTTDELISPDNSWDVKDPCCAKDLTTQRHRRVKVMDLETEGIHAVIFPAMTGLAIEAKSYWQHTGEIVTSRRASAALQKLGVEFNRITTKFGETEDGRSDGSFRDDHHCLHVSNPLEEGAVGGGGEGGDTNNPCDTLVERLSTITNQPAENVFLAPSGMQAIHSALRLSRRLRHQDHRGPGSAVVYGFPYLDTLKMCGRKELCDGVEFFGFGDERDLNTLKFLLSSRAKSSAGKKDPGITCLITEFPSNPLLNIPDLSKLRALADEYNFLIIVDDTIGNFANLDLLKDGVADVICTSLTKIFNGRGDAIAGSLIIGQEGKRGEELRRIMQSFGDGNNHGDLHMQDANAVAINSGDFVERSSRINETAERLADWLRGREEVEKLYYPKFTQGELYEKFLVKGEESSDGHVGGYGGLFSIILKDEICERTFYDSLEICKGPSLGTNFTLACPYTLLAHYHELDFARAYGVQPNLIRVSVGLEEFEDIKKAFENSFEVCRRVGTTTLEGGATGGARGFCTISAGRGGWRPTTRLRAPLLQVPSRAMSEGGSTQRQIPLPQPAMAQAARRIGGRAMTRVPTRMGKLGALGIGLLGL